MLNNKLHFERRESCLFLVKERIGHSGYILLHLYHQKENSFSNFMYFFSMITLDTWMFSAY